MICCAEHPATSPHAHAACGHCLPTLPRLAGVQPVARRLSLEAAVPPALLIPFVWAQVQAGRLHSAAPVGGGRQLVGWATRLAGYCLVPVDAQNPCKPTFPSAAAELHAVIQQVGRGCPWPKRLWRLLHPIDSMLGEPEASAHHFSFADSESRNSSPSPNLRVSLREAAGRARVEALARQEPGGGQAVQLGRVWPAARGSGMAEWCGCSRC